MQKTPESLRLHIGIFGKRNVGKSSILNRIARHGVSIVSPTAGTTTDPVKKAMELQPLGPVLLVDTAGIDDEGSLGGLRIKGTEKVVESTDLAIIAAVAGEWDSFEDRLLEEFNKKSVPVIIVINKIDEVPIPDDEFEKLRGMNGACLKVSAETGEGIEELRQEIIENAPPSWLESAPIISDLIKPGEMAVLVVPIDIEAPRGRILLPQSQTIRDVLDNGSMCIVVKEDLLECALGSLKQPPKIVVTDSQAFAHVSAITPESVPLTSFSILFSRYKGDLVTFAKGANVIDNLSNGDKILIAESCTHHPVGNDIGQIQIPKKLQAATGLNLEFDFTHGTGFPDDLAKYKLIIQCGSCVFNRRQVLHRIQTALSQNVPITNYGMALAKAAGIFRRALKPFIEKYPELEVIAK